jgi:flagellar basal body-associated protein FliL
MKKLIILLASLCLFAAIGATTAFAADTDGNEPSNVTITVVLPDKQSDESPPETTPAPTPVQSTAIVLYPVDVTETVEGNRRQIVKTYELSPLENPADIPRADFERNGWRYSLTDILKRETANAETKSHTETVTLNTDTKDLEKILTLLAPTMEYKTDDEFVGVLTLDVASIKVETAGTKTTSYEMKVTREYPHLSAPDTSLVPKTVTDNGKTYTLAGVDWKAGNLVTIDYEQVPEYYTAYATYTATGSSTKVTGYVTTAVYNGTLAKLSQGKTVYTAYFEGTEIRTPLEMVAASDNQDATPDPSMTASVDAAPEPSVSETPEPTTSPAAAPAKGGGNSNTALYVIIVILALALGGAIYLIIRKGNNNHEKTSGIAADTRDDGGDDD